MSKPAFKVGDRVACSRPPTGRFGFLLGAIGTVFDCSPWSNTYLLHVHWDEHQDNEARPGGAPWYTGGWEERYFEPAAPLSPFDAAVRAYITSELA